MNHGMNTDWLTDELLECPGTDIPDDSVTGHLTNALTILQCADRPAVGVVLFDAEAHESIVARLRAAYEHIRNTIAEAEHGYEAMNLGNDGLPKRRSWTFDSEFEEGLEPEDYR